MNQELLSSCPGVHPSRCAITAPVTRRRCSRGVLNAGVALYFHSVRVSRRGTVIRYCMRRISRLIRREINLIRARGGSVVSGVLPVRGASSPRHREPRQRMLSGTCLRCVYMFRCASGSLQGQVIRTVPHVNRFCFGGRFWDRPRIGGNERRPACVCV